MAERQLSGHPDYQERLKRSGRRIDDALNRLEAAVDAVIERAGAGTGEELATLVQEKEALVRKQQALQKLAVDLGLEVDQAIADVKTVLDA